MAKSKVRKKKSKGTGTQTNLQPRPASRSWIKKAAFGLVVTAALIAGAFQFWKSSAIGEKFTALMIKGQANPLPIKIHPDRGGGHFESGQSYDYGEPFPTSGVHDPDPIGPGFYEETMPATRLVHSLEHGHIVFYYDAPGDDVIAYLKKWSSHFGGHWDGVVAVPSAGLGKAVMVAAWSKTMRLEEFDPPTAAAFIDRYRGRGPENPVR